MDRNDLNQKLPAFVDAIVGSIKEFLGKGN